MELLDLTKEELISFIINAVPDKGICDDDIECAACGDNDGAKYYIICKKCNVLLD